MDYTQLLVNTGCEAGTQLDTTTNKCTDCPIGWYKEGQNNNNCSKCEDYRVNTTTTAVKSTSQNLCGKLNY